MAQGEGIWFGVRFGFGFRLSREQRGPRERVGFGFRLGAHVFFSWAAEDHASNSS